MTDEQKKQMEELKIAVAEGREIIVLKDDDAALVFSGPEVDIYFASQEDDKPVGSEGMLAVTVGYSLKKDAAMWMERLDEVFTICNRLEEDEDTSIDEILERMGDTPKDDSAASNTKEAEDDTVPGKD